MNASRCGALFRAQPEGAPLGPGLIVIMRTYTLRRYIILWVHNPLKAERFRSQYQYAPGGGPHRIGGNGRT